MDRKYTSNKELMKELYDLYYKEMYDAKLRNKYPLYLYSKRVFCAYRNCWRLVNRNKLTQEELDIIKQLGCYKPSRTELGTRWFPPMHRAELPLNE